MCLIKGELFKSAGHLNDLQCLKGLLQTFQLSHFFYPNNMYCFMKAAVEVIVRK